MQRWAPALFSRFRAREREAKKERESAKKKEREKKGKRRASKKKAREFALFPPPTVENRFQSRKPLVGGKARVLSKMYISVGMLKRQREKDTGEETQGRDIREETEG